MRWEEKKEEKRRVEVGREEERREERRKEEKTNDRRRYTRKGFAKSKNSQLSTSITVRAAVTPLLEGSMAPR